MSIEVLVREGNLEDALRKFKKRVSFSGLLKELKRTSFHETRTQRRKVKDRIALRRLKRNQRKRERNDGRG